MQIKKILIGLLMLLPVTVLAQPGLGEMPYEVALPGTKGDTLQLSQYKGKVVLLDFWASWCAPCRVANRDLVKVYKKYKDQGFEIFGVSLDEEENHWIKAIAKDKITWPQVIDKGGWEAATALQWNLQAIPTNFLIDQRGIIVGIDLLPEDIERALKQLLKN